MTLVNLDQALKLILDDLDLTENACRITLTSQEEILEAMRRAYRLAESKEEMMKMIGEPPAPQA